MLAWIFDECREGQIPCPLGRFKIDAPLLAAGYLTVKPDGSRVLVVTMSIGGMETTMSLEISKPTEAANEKAEHDIDNNMSS